MKLEVEFLGWRAYFEWVEYFEAGVEKFGWNIGVEYFEAGVEKLGVEKLGVEGSASRQTPVTGCHWRHTLQSSFVMEIN